MENRKSWIFFIALSICLLLIIAINVSIQDVNAEVLKNGAEWKVNGNGHIDKLTFSYNTNGGVSGTMYGDRIIGFWDNPSQKIIFMRLDNPSDPSSFQTYTGYLFIDIRPNLNPQGTANLCYQSLAGSFLTPAGGGGSSSRNEFGWFAETQILCD